MRRLVLLTVALSCLAFTVIRDPDSLQPIHWPTRQATFVIQQNGSDDVGDGSDLAAMRASLQTWSQVPCSDFTLVDGGTDGSRAIGRDGVSRITFLETNWPGGANGAGAFTTRHRNTNADPDEWVESDIRLNGEFFEWATDGDQRRLDIQSIVTHELGHSIGFQHASDPEATMYFSVSLGTTAGRTLHEDDIAALCFVYPQAAPFTCLDDRDCPLYYGQLGGADVRTRCDNGACVVGGVDVGVDCYADGDCAGGLCIRNPLGPPPAEPGTCSQDCSSTACPVGSLCSNYSNAQRCYVGRDDCAEHADCSGGNERCIHDLDGRWRCVQLCREDEHCDFLPGAVCHGGDGVDGPSWCRVPGPNAAGAPCDHGLECASLACTEGGANPTCAAGVPGFVADGGVRDAGPRDGGRPRDAGPERDAGSAAPRDGGVQDAGVVAPARDAGEATDPMPMVEAEEGGCACTGARDRGRWSGWIAIVAMLFVTRRRR